MELRNNDTPTLRITQVFPFIKDQITVFRYFHPYVEYVHLILNIIRRMDLITSKFVLKLALASISSKVNVRNNEKLKFSN